MSNAGTLDLAQRRQGPLDGALLLFQLKMMSFSPPAISAPFERELPDPLF